MKSPFHENYIGCFHVNGARVKCFCDLLQSLYRLRKMFEYLCARVWLRKNSFV